MDIKSVKDMQELSKPKKGETASYESPKYLIEPHEGETLYLFAVKEYLKAKGESMKSGSPLITTSYKQFIERYKKNLSGNK